MTASTGDPKVAKKTAQPVVTTALWMWRDDLKVASTDVLTGVAKALST